MSELHAAIIPVTPFQQNCTLIWSDADKVAAVVDPGGEIDRIKMAIERAEVTVEKILLTHGHIDHAAAAADLRDELKVPIEGPHEADRFLLNELEAQGRAYGIPARSFTPDRWLQEGDTVQFSGTTFEVFHCPGHSPGSVIFFHPKQRFALVGDVLFRGSVGRTDLPGGDSRTLIRSIVDKVLPLGDDVTFICGHGPSSTIGQERLYNPFLQENIPL